MDTKESLSMLTALSQDTRLSAFRLLVQAGPDGLPSGAIAERLGVRQNTMSSHLSILENSGLVRSERSGRIVRYAADFGAIRTLLAFLLEDCCGGNAEICRPLLDVLERAC